MSVKGPALAALAVVFVLLLAPATAFAQDPTPVAPPEPVDGRLDPGAFSLVPYCGYRGGLVLLRTNPITNQGESFLEASLVEIGDAVARAVASRVPVLVAARGGATVYALPTYELQINDFNTRYQFIIRADACGAPVSTPGQAAPAVQQEQPAYGDPVYTAPSWAAPSNGYTRTHVVRAGENLFRIALRYGVPLSRLAAVNGISNPARIYAGQTLVIP